MVDLAQKFDVLVIGGGNAALCAAISARRSGASVLVLEGAPKFYRGGNTRHTRNMRCAHDDGKPSADMFAAGEIMAGNVLGKGYAAGIGMTIASVFGRIAGREAAQNARN